MGILAALRPIRRVAVFRALQLGDLLCTVPALRALRRALPESEITLIGLPWARSFVARFSAYLDHFIEFPGYPGLPEREPALRDLPRFLATVQDCRFDLAIQMHGSGTITNPLVAAFGARRTAGYAGPGAYCPDAGLFLPFPEQENEVRIHLRLMGFLGVTSESEALEFPLSDDDRSALRSMPEVARLMPGAYACIHPGARLRSRRDRLCSPGPRRSGTWWRRCATTCARRRSTSPVGPAWARSGR
jgi:ADP-heptose:LPS heptosyltransferase